MAATRKQIRESLMEQLEAKGADIDLFIDQVDDYMKLWSLKRKLATDISRRGVTYQEVSSTGIMITKNNPSNKELIMVNKQMLCLLKELEISTGNAIKHGGGDSDALI